MHLFSKRKQSMPTRACIFYKPFTITFAVCAFATGTISAELADAIDRPHTGEPQGELTIREAYAYALVNSPRLEGYAIDIRISEAETLQSGLLPNPELEVEAEEFGGSDETSGFDNAESTVLLSQLLELGGKRNHRVKTAKLGEDVSRFAYEQARIYLLTEVSKAFISVLAAQEQLELLQQNVKLASQALDGAETRVESGEASPLEQLKAQSVLASEEISARQAERKLDAARRQLAELYGSDDPKFSRASGKLRQSILLPTQESLKQAFERHPEMLRWAALLEQHRQVVALEESKSIPDLTLGVGLKHFNGNDNLSGVVQFSVPIPLFDRNQGNIRKAREELGKAYQDSRASRINVLVALTSTYRKLEFLRSEVENIEQNLLSSSQSVQEKTYRAYEEGKASYLEVIDAQRMFAEARIRHNETLVEYNKAFFELEALAGRPLSEITSSENNEHENL
ncbi:MAG: TolC family protein [Wenzhouxiangella sp.]|jgi:cobalt-zinc-cadmium efflux system outer membrane protein|nr:TolC family protein [Wenzhouxiangella sp.]